MTRALPDPAAVPLLRNPRWDPRIVPPVLPGFRHVADDRVLIGIGFTEADSKESRVASATRIRRDPDGTETWTFTTGEDFDAMTGLTLTLAPARDPPSRTTVKITLRHSAEFPGLMVGGDVSVPADQAGGFTVRAPRPIVPFSIGRPSWPFVLNVRAGEGQAVAAIDILGIKVNLDGYTTVNREDDCFTAVKDVLVADSKSTQDRAWPDYVASITNVGRP